MPFAIAGGIAAGTAIAAGAAVTAGGVAAIVAGTAVAVGLTMTVIGAATGNKGLMQVGGLVGLGGGIVGGLGSLADTAATNAGTAAAGESAAAGGAPTAEQAAANGAMNTAETTTSTLDGLPSNSTSGNVFADGAINPTDAAVNSGNQAADFVKSGGAVATSSPIPINTIKPAVQPLGSTVNAESTAAAGSKGAKDASTFFDFLKSPGGMQTTGGLLTGLFNAQQLSNQNQLNQGELALNQQNQAYNQNVQSYMLNNANAIAPINMSATPVTQAQVDAAKVNNAINAKQQANAITG